MARARVVMPSGVVISVQMMPCASVIWSSIQPVAWVFSPWWKRHLGARLQKQVAPPAAGSEWLYSVMWSRSLVQAGRWQPGQVQWACSARTAVSQVAVGR